LDPFQIPSAAGVLGVVSLSSCSCTSTLPRHANNKELRSEKAELGRKSPERKRREGNANKHKEQLLKSLSAIKETRPTEMQTLHCAPRSVPLSGVQWSGVALS